MQSLKLKAFVKKEIDIIVALLIGFLFGACGGSILDLILLPSSGRYPYRVPFENFCIIFGFIAAITISLIYITYISTRKNIEAGDKLLRLVKVVSIAFGVAVIFSVFCWMLLVELIHDFKRAVGLSHP